MKQKKCKCCREHYFPSVYIHEQEYCSKDDCKAESNRESSRKYRKKIKIIVSIKLKIKSLLNCIGKKIQNIQKKIVKYHSKLMC